MMLTRPIAERRRDGHRVRLGVCVAWTLKFAVLTAASVHRTTLLWSERQRSALGRTWTTSLALPYCETF
jgi:hypothetical protein